jgi:acetylornithine deacetylase
MLELLKSMIAIPSVSRTEEGTATLLAAYLAEHGVACVERCHNNVWALLNGDYRPERPTLLLNSHHDTVRPSAAYTRDPYTPELDSATGRLYGLGSNDAGASVVSLIAAFLHYHGSELPFNLILAITAEEEVGGENGIRALLQHWEQRGIKVDMALVGEPTQMQAAVGERGLVVLDCTARAAGGHAARGTEADNALYAALDDIDRLRHLHFERESALLGPIKITATQITAGRQHNVIPEECTFVVDVRTTDAYSNEETARLIADAIRSECRPRSTRVHASAIAESHPLVRAAVACGASTFVSPTTSDMSLLHGIPSLKMGPGDSARSHTADEYVLTEEITAGIKTYIDYIAKLANCI